MDGIEDILRDYDYINFEPQGENWSVYRLTDSDVIIKLKTVLLKLLRQPDGYTATTQVVMTALCPEELRRSPSRTPIPTNPKDLEEVLTQVDLDSESIKEPWNDYKLDGGSTLSLRTMALSFASTKLYDDMGDPVFYVTHSTIVKATPLI
jgi:hypothetical protein